MVADSMSREPIPSLDSALVWLPPIEAAGLPVPRTIIVPYDHGRAMDALERSGPYLSEVARAVFEAAQDFIGAVFVRTDLCSAKHDGPTSYRLANDDEALHVVGRTIEDAELKLWPEAVPAAILVRQWINIAAPFSAFGGHPIGHEWRYFVSGGAVACRHYYWPQMAIKFFAGLTPPPDWPTSLLALAHSTPPLDINALALRAGLALQDRHDGWSVDFAKDDAGAWWLIDMARAERSFHEFDDGHP